MKKILLSLLAVATLAACAQDETIGNYNQEAIDFDIPFVDNATKATDPTYGAGDNQVKLTEFYVYGTVTGTNNGIVPIFTGNKVTGEVGANAWSCDVKQYWIADATYNFAAVKNGIQTETETMPTTVPSLTVENGLPTAIKYTTETQYDLLYATASATGLASGNQPVDFQFKHLLSKAYFTVKSNTADGYFHKVTNITVKNFAEGTYTIANENPWSTYEAAPNTAISFGDIDNIESTDTNGVTNATQMLLIPTKSKFEVSFTVEIWNGTTKLGSQDYNKEVEIKNGEEVVGLQAGHAYNFQLNLSVGELIQFTVTAAPEWANDTNVTL